MADMTVNFVMVVNNGYLDDTVNPGQIEIEQTTAGRGGHCQTIGETEEALDFGDVGTYGVLYLRNLDTSDSIDYGPDSGGSMVAMGTIEPGEIAFLRLKDGITVKAQCMGGSGSTAKLDVRLYDD